MRYDMRCVNGECARGGVEHEVSCSADSRHDQVCLGCGHVLEIVLAPVAATRFGFGFAPGIGSGANVSSVPKRRPATTQRGS